eukprot:219928-Rhodomonas_salina.1
MSEGTEKERVACASTGRGGPSREGERHAQEAAVGCQVGPEARWDAAAVAAELGWQRAERTEKRAEEFTASWEMTGARELWEGERREQGVGEVEVGFRCGV